MEVLAGGAGVDCVLSIGTSVVSSAQVVGCDFEVTIGEARTSRILTSRWKISLALTSDLVEVLALLTAQQCVDRTGTGEVLSTQGVEYPSSILSPDTSWILATSWELGLALPIGGVEVLASLALEGSVETAGASVVGCAQIVDEVRTVDSAGTTRILATIRERDLALACDSVEILSILTVATSVESFLASEVRCAEVVDQVYTIGSAGTSRILAPSGHCSLALFSLDIEILSLGSGAAESSVESVRALIVAGAEVVGEVETIDDAIAAWISAA